MTSAVGHKFAGKERDAESGLDYFGARYFSGPQGRFTSADPLLSSVHVASPQSWNRYAYSLNNPLRYQDAYGLWVYAEGTTDDEKKRFEAALKRIQQGRDSFKKGSTEYNQLAAALSAFGAKGVDNGVTVAFDSANGAAGATDIGISVLAGTSNKAVTADNPFGQRTTVNLDLARNMTNGSVDLRKLAISAAHEGTHVSQGAALVGALPVDLTSAGDVLGGPLNLTKYASEFQAYTTSSFAAQGAGLGSLKVGGNFEIWNSGWKAADVLTLRSNGINGVLSDPNGPYKVTPGAPGEKLIPYKK